VSLFGSKGASRISGEGRRLAALRLVLVQRRSNRMGRDRRIHSFFAAPALIGRAECDCNAEEGLIAISYMFNSRFALLPAMAAMVAASNVSTEAR
jgi:hypothetical protein